MPDGQYITMPLGALNCASTKPLEKNEVEFPLVYPVLFHTSVLYCFYILQILVKYPVNFQHLRKQRPFRGVYFSLYKLLISHCLCAKISVTTTAPF